MVVNNAEFKSKKDKKHKSYKNICLELEPKILVSYLKK